MPMVLQKSAGLDDLVKVVETEETTWSYYECSNCGEEYKSDFPYERLFCLSCGKAMHRNALGHPVEYW